MNRTHYFNYIEEKLGVLSHRINSKGKLNILDLHLHSENFFMHFLNRLYDWEFSNKNGDEQNAEAIDLIDHKNHCICQISATNTKAKVESALSKDSVKEYLGYNFKFISISQNSSTLRTKTFANPHGIKFNPENDIIDNNSILNKVLSADIEKQKDIFDFISKELGNTLDVAKLDSNLAIIINVLSKEKLELTGDPTINRFEIQRKVNYNNLLKVQGIIDDNMIFFERVDKQYDTLDASGANKSLSVLQSINRIYIAESIKEDYTCENSLFLIVIDKVITKVMGSANLIQIPHEELEFCVTVLVVNAFIRCKIFKNPLDYDYVATRQYTPIQLRVL